MGEVVNLRVRRKQEKRQRDEKNAEANRLAHGLGKAERQLGEKRRDKAARHLERHRRETDGE
jgi:hypothetical protein